MNSSVPTWVEGARDGPGRSCRETGGWDAGAAGRMEGIGNGQVVREAEGRRAKQRATEEGQSFGTTPPTGRMTGFTYNKGKPVDTEHSLPGELLPVSVG